MRGTKQRLCSETVSECSSTALSSVVGDELEGRKRIYTVGPLVALQGVEVVL